MKKELVIIGGGPAGLTAAIYAKRAGLDFVLIEKGAFGGQVNTTSHVENWPGQKNIGGGELAKTLKDHAEHLGCEFKKAAVQSLVPGKEYHTIVTNEGSIEAKSVIIASGAVFRHLGCKGEEGLIGMGVSFCAVCDGAFFEGEEVAVIGGGNTAVEEACYLTRFASKVYVVHRRDQFRADKTPCDRLAANPKIEPVMDSVVESINGTEMVEGITVKNVKTGALRELPVAGVFVFVGTIPVAKFAENVVETSEGGWIKTDADMCTSVPGIFAAGDVRETGLRQIITASGDGARAAMSAYHYLTSHA